MIFMLFKANKYIYLLLNFQIKIPNKCDLIIIYEMMNRNIEDTI